MRWRGAFSLFVFMATKSDIFRLDSGTFSTVRDIFNWDIFDDTGNISSHVYGDKTGYFRRDCMKFLAMFVAMKSDIFDET